MITADRTAIRRRLAIGRRTHGPPWSAHKTRHRSIVAPLAALAATVALGAGVAIARAERDRRAARGHRLGLLAGEPPADGVQRMAVGQLDLVLELLARHDAGALDATTVHEMRKALKRFRALLRLLRAELGEDAYSREDAVARGAGRVLAGARDAEVMRATLEQLIARHPRKLGGHAGVERLRGRLTSERDDALVAALADRASRAAVLGELRECRARVIAWRLTRGCDTEVVEPGLLKLYGRGRARYRRARRAKGGDSERMHAWRKRVKDLRYSAEALGPAPLPADAAARPGGGRGRPSKKSKGNGRRQRRAGEARESLERLARRADRLGEVLGEDHDLGVLDAWVAAQLASGPGRPIGHRRARELRALIARRRKKLQKRALRDGERLFGHPPKRFVRRVAAAARSAAAPFGRRSAS